MRPFATLPSLLAGLRSSPSETANGDKSFLFTIRRSLPSLKLYGAFTILALIAGPVQQFVSSAFVTGSAAVQSGALGVASFCATIALAIIAAICRTRAPRRTGWTALLVLAVPQWLLLLLGAGSAATPGLNLGWGTQLLLTLAAPLWLGLLSASGAAEIEVPRPVIATAIVGMGAVCLSLPIDATEIGWRDASALIVYALVGISVVASWVYARPRLAGCPAVSVAAAYLGISSVGYILYALLFQHDSLHAAELGLAWATLLPEIAILALAWTLWFWLLQRLSLAAFSMRILATYAASLLPGFLLFGLGQWRMDAAFVISCIAVGIALRATPAGEQPVSLGLTIS